MPGFVALRNAVGVARRPLFCVCPRELPQRVRSPGRVRSLRDVPHRVRPRACARRAAAVHRGGVPRLSSALRVFSPVALRASVALAAASSGSCRSRVGGAASICRQPSSRRRGIARGWSASAATRSAHRWPRTGCASRRNGGPLWNCGTGGRHYAPCLRASGAARTSDRAHAVAADQPAAVLRRPRGAIDGRSSLKMPGSGAGEILQHGASDAAFTCGATD